MHAKLLVVAGAPCQPVVSMERKHLDNIPTGLSTSRRHVRLQQITVS